MFKFQIGPEIFCFFFVFETLSEFGGEDIEESNKARRDQQKKKVSIYSSQGGILLYRYDHTNMPSHYN